jgi:hypothetical protein
MRQTKKIMMTTSQITLPDDDRRSVARTITRKTKIFIGCCDESGLAGRIISIPPPRGFYGSRHLQDFFMADSGIRTLMAVKVPLRRCGFSIAPSRRACKPCHGPWSKHGVACLLHGWAPTLPVRALWHKHRGEQDCEDDSGIASARLDRVMPSPAPRAHARIANHGPHGPGGA